MSIKELCELKEQYMGLRNSNAVKSIQLNSVAGPLLIENENVINTVLDTLINETQVQITKETKQ